MRLAAVAALTLAACGAPTDFGPASATCGSCHAAQAGEWSASRHATGAASPVFLALLPRVEAAWGQTARARCVACHQPGHVEGETIGCASCHLAIGNRGEADGALVVKLDAPIGTRRPVSAPHATTERPFFGSASLCGTCHEVRGPRHLDEPTLTEFRASAFADDDSCTGCHLDDGHRFAGLAPPFGATPEEATAAAQRTRRLLARAVTVEVDGFEVHVRNGGAGHAFPTGMTSLRDAWLDVEARYADGSTRRFSRALEFGARLERDGEPVLLVTDATRVVSRSLQPGEARTWRLPEEARPGLSSLRATVHARAYRAGVLEALGLPGLDAEVPEHLVSEWLP
jgi:hypothetical protein